MSEQRQLPDPAPKTPAAPRSGFRQFVDAILYVGVYLGLGALTHASLIGPTFDPHSLWSWGVLLAWWWPVFLIVGKWVGIALLFTVGVAAGFAAVLGLAYFAYSRFNMWRFRRDMKRRADSGMGFS